MDLGTSGHVELASNNDQQHGQQHGKQQQNFQQQQQQQQSSAVPPLSPLRPAPIPQQQLGASMLQAASNYYSTPPSSLMHDRLHHHHDLASATKMSSKLAHAPSGNGLGSAPLLEKRSSSNDNNMHKTSDQVVTDQAREILRQAVVTAVTESNAHAAAATAKAAAAAGAVASNGKSKLGATVVRYRECMKNHAAGIGGHAIDGCGEFMPGGGDDGDGDALRCAACDCHRNFHRREVDGELACDCKRKLPQAGSIGGIHPNPQHATLHPPTSTSPTLALTGNQMTPLTMAAAMSAGDSDDQDEGPGHIVTSGGMMMSMHSPSAIKKRFRTKFTAEQKDKMLAFAEKVGWRIQKHDEAAVHEFCATVGVKRHVLKVWMHNNKHTMGKKP